MAETQQTPPTPPKSNEDAMQEAFAEALKAEGLVKGSEEAPKEAAPVEAPKEEPKEAAPPAPEAPKEEPPPDAFLKHFEKVAKKSEEVRLREEKVKAKEALLNGLPEASLMAFARALQSGDPMALLSAAGFNYGDVANQVVSGEKPTKTQEAPKESPPVTLPPEIQQRLQRLDQVEAYIAQQQRADLLNRTKNAIPEKFKLVKGLEATEAVIQFAEDFARRTGELPGKTFEESVAIAAEAVEAHLAQQAQRWSKVLTPGQPGGSVPSEAQTKAPPAGSSVPVPKTITNAATAPAAAKPEPTTREEAISALLKDPEFINSL